MYFDEKGTHPHRPLNEPNYYYYASDDATERLKRETVTLPEGFEFFTLDAQHAKEAAKVMPHADEGEVDIIRLQLSTLPGVGIHCVETGELAAFEYTNGFGFITNLYTVPKFRHRGLGTAVERRMSQRVAQ
ncbi:FR47-like, partial [Aphelenchoides avenae]